MTVAVPASEDTKMLKALLDGASYEDVSRVYGLSRERVRQRMEARGWGPTIAAERDRRLERLKVERDERRLAERTAVRKFEARHTANFGKTEWPDERIVAVVKEWMEAGGSGKATDFPGPPSGALITQRLGWANVLTMAGYTPARRYRSRRADRLSDEEVLQGVVEFLQDPTVRNGSAQEYDSWCQHHGRASTTTVRVRLGSWTDAKALALSRLPAPLSA